MDNNQQDEEREMIESIIEQCGECNCPACLSDDQLKYLKFKLGAESES